MNIKQLKFVSAGLFFVVALMSLALAQEKVAPDYIVKEDRLVLSDGSAIALDYLTYYETASEYFEKGEHPAARHSIGRIALPHKCNLPNGSVLKPGWYNIIIEFKSGSDKLWFTRTKGIECLESIYKELSSDIDYRISHADTNGDGTIDDRERRRAFDASGAFSKEEILDPVSEALRKPHLRPTYFGGDDSFNSPSILPGWGTVREEISVSMQLEEIDQPRTRKFLEIRPAEKQGSFILEVEFGLYMGTISLTMIAE